LENTAKADPQSAAFKDRKRFLEELLQEYASPPAVEMFKEMNLAEETYQHLEPSINSDNKMTNDDDSTIGSDNDTTEDTLTELAQKAPESPAFKMLNEMYRAEEGDQKPELDISLENLATDNSNLQTAIQESLAAFGRANGEGSVQKSEPSLGFDYEMTDDNDSTINADNVETDNIDLDNTIRDFATEILNLQIAIRESLEAFGKANGEGGIQKSGPSTSLHGVSTTGDIDLRNSIVEFGPGGMKIIKRN
jgi:hypothetical protein